MTTSESFKRSLYFNFATNFLENEDFFQKIGVPCFFGTSKIENTSFPFITSLSEANVKTNRNGDKNGPITKSGVLPVSTLFFWKIYSSFRTS